MLVIGVDPGLTGACSVLDHTGLRAVFDIPTMPIPGVGEKALVQRKVDGRALCSALLKACPPDAPTPILAVEAVGTMGGANNAVQTQGSLLRSLGAIETVAECLRWPVEYVQPQTWKRWYGLIDSKLTPSQRKAKSLECARKLFPDCADIERARDNNRAESMLIAHFVARSRA